MYSNELTFLHTSLFEDTTYDFVSFAYPALKLGTFGIGVSLLRSTGFEGRSDVNEATGNFDENDLAVMLSYGKILLDKLSAGATVKIIYQQISIYKDIGVGLDLGVKYQLFDFVIFGAVLQNVIPPSVKLKDDVDTFPFAVKAGTCLRLFDGTVNLNIDADKTGVRDIKLRGGVEYMPLKFLAIRAGIDETEITGGIGLSHLGYSLDYAIASLSLGISHRASFTVAFGAFDLGLDIVPKVFSPVGSLKTVEVRIKGRGKYGINKWQVTIKNYNGDMIKNYSGKGQPPELVEWDGKDENGTLVPDGRYDIQIKLSDKVGGVDIANESVSIQTQIPGSNMQMELK
jgi:hypothetical protein